MSLLFPYKKAKKKGLKLITRTLKMKIVLIILQKSLRTFRNMNLPFQASQIHMHYPQNLALCLQLRIKQLSSPTQLK